MQGAVVFDCFVKYDWLKAFLEGNILLFDLVNLRD